MFKILSSKTKINDPVLFSIAVLLVLGILSRLGFAAIMQFPSHGDPSFYLSVAKNIALGKGLTIDYIWHYLYAPAAISHPANDYWMPLTSVIMSIPIFLFGTSVFSALLPSILLSAGIGLISYLTALRYSGSKLTALIALLITIFLPYLFVQSLATETVAYYAFFGSLSLYFMMQGFKENKYFIFAAIPAALAHATRQDGILFLSTLIICVLISGREKALKARTLISIAAIYLLLLSPLFINNFFTFGAILPVWSSKTIFLKNYEDLFSYNNELSLSVYISWGAKNIILSKLLSIKFCLEHIVRDIGFIPLLLSCSGIIISVREKNKRLKMPFFAPPVLFIIILCAFYFILASIIGEHGGFTKSFSALIPFLMTSSAVAITSYIKTQKSRLIIVSVITVYFFYTGAGSAASLILQNECQALTFNQIKKSLKEESQKHPNEEVIVMTRYPWQFNYLTGYKAVQIPNNDLDTIFEVAKKYNANYLLLPAPERENLMEIFRGNIKDPRFTFARSPAKLNNIKIYRINIRG